MAKDWFRNESWSDEIAEAFFAKLKRARDKSQYLRIQACTLASREPRVALDLLDRYFSGDDHFDRAQAWVDRATAYLSLGDTDAAVEAYERALRQEAIRPSVLTNAWLDLPVLVVREKRVALYPRALEILNLEGRNLTFPMDRYKFHGSSAIIQSKFGNQIVAHAHAMEALSAAAQTTSDFRYHQKLGLVGTAEDGFSAEIEMIAGRDARPTSMGRLRSLLPTKH
jgi:tetratricopeptide (TPR) repeat protein